MSLFRTTHQWLSLSRFDHGVRDWAGSALLLALRLFVGWQFFKAGMIKLHDWDATLALFHDEYKVPVLPPTLAAYVGAFGELFFPSMLFSGFCTRAAALGLFAVNAMAVISYPQLWEFECPAAINDHKYWGMLILVVACFGAGRASLDWLLRRNDASTASA